MAALKLVTFTDYNELKSYMPYLGKLVMYTLKSFLVVKDVHLADKLEEILIMNLSTVIRSSLTAKDIGV